MGNEIITVKKYVIQDELKYNDVTVLSYKIEYPQFTSVDLGLCLAKINRFYYSTALEYEQHCKTELFHAAVEQFKDMVKNNFPVHPCEALQISNITYCQGCIISLYYDRYEYMGGAHGTTVRASQTWQVQKCKELPLEQFVHCQSDYKTYVFSEIKTQVQTHQDYYFTKTNTLLVKTFNKNSFYCTPQGLVIYYQQYDIAPYSGGIREFLIPYSECVSGPNNLCW